jgi:hypothetical protein
MKTAGKLACLLYPSSAHCRTFETRCPSRQEGKSVCNKLVDRCRKMNCAFSSFQLAPGNPDVRNLVGTFIPRVTASDARQQAGKHLRSTLFMYVAGASSPTGKKPKGKGDARGLLYYTRSIRGISRPNRTTDRISSGTLLSGEEFRANFVVAIEDLFLDCITAELRLFVSPVKVLTVTVPLAPGEVIPEAIEAVKRITCS